MAENKLDRRDFVKVSGAGLLGAALAGTGNSVRAQKAPAASGRSGGPVRIVFLVSDGMSMGVPSMAEEFSQLVRGRGTHFHGLLHNPTAARGFFQTPSLSSLVTDSAAASTAWSSGSRVFNGALNVLPDGTLLRPILPIFQEKGFGTGLVTTTRLTHATPAGFTVSHPNRNDEDPIAAKMMEAGVDVMLGGGKRHFEAVATKDGKPLAEVAKAAGYAFADTKQAMAAAPSGKLLGTFYGSHLPYTIDHMNSEELKGTVPTLAEMTRVALERLLEHENGFLLQVEGGRVDHAAHSSDAAAILWDQLAFDDAVGVALEMAAEHPDILVVVTSDHGNANPGLNGIGSGYSGSTAAFEKLAEADASFELLRPQLEGAASAEAVGAIIARHLGIELEAAHLATLAARLKGEEVPVLNKAFQSPTGVLGNLLANYNGVGWTSSSHTLDWVPLAATGPGAEAWAGVHHLTAAKQLFQKPAGIEHTNPSMTPAQAAEYREAAAAFSLPREDAWG